MVDHPQPLETFHCPKGAVELHNYNTDVIQEFDYKLIDRV